MKKVLMIAYHFPPSASSGVYRILRFVKYLEGFGWKPIVLTAKDGFDYGVGNDETLLNEVPKDVRVIRTHSFEPPNLYWKFRSRHTKGIGELVRDSSEEVNMSHLRRTFTKMKSFFINLLSFPDRYVGWMPFALVRALILLRQEDINVVFTTSPPVTVHLVGYILKKIIKKPWVADFRDPWTQNIGFKGNSKLQMKIGEFMEHRLLQSCDGVISVSEPIENDFKLKYPNIGHKKFYIITNGFDAEDFRGVIGNPSEKFTITYTGSLYGRRTPRFFLEAIKSLLQERRELENEMRIIFMGSVGEENRAKIKSLHLEKVIKVVDNVNHQSCIQCLMSSDVLLLIIGKGPGAEGVYTSKIFEYLNAKRPILALVPDGVAADLIRRARAGCVVDPENVTEMKGTLYGLYQQYKNGGLEMSPDQEVIQEFEAPNLTRKLVGILDKVCS